jgi:hypothetical protein
MMIHFTYPTVEKICFRFILDYFLVSVFFSCSTDHGEISIENLYVSGI